LHKWRAYIAHILPTYRVSFYGSLEARERRRRAAKRQFSYAAASVRTLIRGARRIDKFQLFCFRLPRHCKTSSARLVREEREMREKYAKQFPSIKRTYRRSSGERARPRISPDVFSDSALNKSPLSPRERERERERV
jgi:hypothetical protein